MFWLVILAQILKIARFWPFWIYCYTYEGKEENIICLCLSHPNSKCIFLININLKIFFSQIHLFNLFNFFLFKVQMKWMIIHLPSVYILTCPHNALIPIWNLSPVSELVSTSCGCTIYMYFTKSCVISQEFLHLRLHYPFSNRKAGKNCP